MGAKKLTDKEELFCREYCIDLNKTQAAIRAGYSKKSARQAGCNLCIKVYIQDRIKEIQGDLSEASGVTALRNILELKKLAYTNLSDFKDGWMTEKEFEELTLDQKAALSEIQHTTKTFDGGSEKIVKFRLHDKQKAIDGLNKMLGFNAPDKSEVKIESNMSEDERLNKIAELTNKLNKGK